MKNVKDVAKVSLKYEADVNALEADYAALTNLGFKPASTKTWEEVKKSDGTGTGTYTNKVLVETDTYLKVTFLINYVNKLRAMSDAIVDYTEALVAMNAASGNAVTVKNASTKVPVYKTSTDKCKDGKNNDSHNHGIAATFTTLEFTFKDVKDGGNNWSKAIEDAYKAYNQFMVDNNKDNDKKSNKDTALENAMKTLEDLKFIVIKNKAYVAISNVTDKSTGFNWRNTNSDFATQKALSLAAIEMAADLETVAYILEGFYEMTSVSYTAIEFAGATIFNTDGALKK
jgi:Holliday junction resolvasome RuvABC DNA-binding subunit